MKNKYWKGAAVENIGPVHIRQNISMQDANRLCFFKSGFIAVVSDGLGSKTHSDFGSNVACKIFIKYAKKWIRKTKKSPDRFINNFHKYWVHVIEKSGYKIKDCSATLLGVVCNEKEMFLFRLGDGMIVCLSDNQNILVSDKKNGSFSNITKCLGNINSREDWQYLKINIKFIKSVFLCTDGISDDLENSCEIDFVQDMSDRYKDYSCKQIKLDMKQWISNWPVLRHTDDKTAIFITKRGNV